MTVTSDDAFGLSEEKRKGWVLLSISDEGHPTFGCPGCWTRHSITEKGASLPASCRRCKKALRAPVIGHHVARAHLERGGHANLTGNLDELPPDEKRVPAFRVRVRAIEEQIRLASKGPPR